MGMFIALDTAAIINVFRLFNISESDSGMDERL